MLPVSSADETGEKEMGAYDEGFKARQQGKAASDNPYPPHSTERASWLAGWEDLNTHLNDRDEALESIGWFGTRSRYRANEKAPAVKPGPE